MDSSVLKRESVITGLESVSKEEAIRYVGNMLVDLGCVDSSYVDAMVERDANVSTFLGNGVAMPHGTFESKEAVKKTGIVVAQYPQGIDWDGVGTAHIVIGLGAVGDDHVEILSHMAEILQDEERAEKLWDTTDTEFLYTVLTTAADEDDDDEDEVVDGPLVRSITISGEGGLHARPASMIVEFAKSFEGQIVITKGEKTAKANSIMSLLALGAVANDEVVVSVEGSDPADTAAAANEVERILTTPENEL